MNKKSIYIVFLVLFATSCSNTKYLADGELLYMGGKVTVKDSLLKHKERKELQSKLNEIIRPIPNKSFLGLRPKLFFYNIAGDVKKEKGFRHWLKYKVGEPPVLFSKVDLEYNRSLLQNFSENNGFFNTSTSADSTRHDKRVTAEYIVKPNQQYKIKAIKYPVDSSDIDNAVGKTQLNSLLKVGNQYSLDAIKAERIRIDTRLKENGFYHFNPDYLKVQVDSTVGNHEVDLIIKVKDEAPKMAKTPFKINKIIVYPNFALNQDSLSKIEMYKGFTIIGNNGLFKPRIYDHTLYFKKDDLYNRTNHNLSLNRLVNLGTFKFVKNQFRVSNNFSNYLDAYYYLTPLPQKSFRVEILAKTNSANYSGTELKINWSNRNTFHGAELLKIAAFGGFEVQSGGQNNEFNVYRIGSEASLTWPRFISPFKLKSSSGYVPRTNSTIGYEFQNRQKLYSIQTFKASFGYAWKENLHSEHLLNITEITFASPKDITDLYKEQVALNPSLKKVIIKQLIFGPTYTYTYDTEIDLRKVNTVYYRGGIDLSGNVYGLVSGANIKKGDTVKVLGIPFSQFIKFQHEFKYAHKFNKNSLLKSRIIIGAAFANGNSDEIPFSKQFFIGGTNSLRGFRSRALGPGTYDGSNLISAFIPDQSGDVKLEFNTEYRSKIYRFIYGATFIDAGNIWLLNKDISKPGSEFSNEFMKEIAVDAGIGLRFDFSFLVLRTDLAIPIRKPYLADGKRWVINEINFGSSSWRKENLIFNLAIGYPF